MVVSLRNLKAFVYIVLKREGWLKKIFQKKQMSKYGERGIYRNFVACIPHTTGCFMEIILVLGV